MGGYVRGHLASFRISEKVVGLHLFIIVMLGAICYCNTFSVPFYFDDYDIIVNNPGISGSNPWDVLWDSGPRRVADFSFAVNYKLHGLQVAGYHILNLAIHLSTAVVLYFLCLALLEALDLSGSGSASENNLPARNKCRFIPLAASLLFVSHPLQTQAVTYIVQRYASLAALFYLLAMLAYAKGRIRFELRGFNSGVAGWGLFLMLMALLGFYTKPVVYSLPLMILMFELCLFRGRLLKLLLTVLGTIGILLVLAKIMPALLNGTISDFVFDLRHATSVDIYSSRISYFLTQLRAIATYLRLLIIPVGQRLDYDYPEYSSLLNIEVAASLALHVILVSLALLLYSRSRHLLSATDCERGRSLRLIAIGIAWFYIALSVTSSFIPIPDDFAEHRVYLPSAGLFIAFAAIVQVFIRRFKDGLRYQWMGLTTLCLILTLITITRNQVWGDELRFWRNEVSLSPRNGRVLANLGFVYLRRENYEQALRTFVDALKLDPALEEVWMELGPTLQGLGRYQGRFSTGEEYLTPERDLDYRWYRQFYSSSFNAMGLTSEFIGQPEEALKWYKKSLTLSPEFDVAWFNLGLVSLRFGIIDQVNLAILKLEKLNPQLATVLKDKKSPDYRAR